MRHTIRTNANHFKRDGLHPVLSTAHVCTCRFCHATYTGHGAKCPACIRKDQPAQDLQIAIANASVETRIQNARTEDWDDPAEPPEDASPVCPSCGDKRIVPDGDRMHCLWCDYTWPIKEAS